MVNIPGDGAKVAWKFKLENKKNVGHFSCLDRL